MKFCKGISANNPIKMLDLKTFRSNLTHYFFWLYNQNEENLYSSRNKNLKSSYCSKQYSKQLLKTKLLLKNNGF